MGHTNDSQGVRVEEEAVTLSVTSPGERSSCGMLPGPKKSGTPPELLLLLFLGTVPIHPGRVQSRISSIVTLCSSQLRNHSSYLYRLDDLGTQLCL